MYFEEVAQRRTQYSVIPKKPRELRRPAAIPIPRTHQPFRRTMGFTTYFGVVAEGDGHFLRGIERSHRACSVILETTMKAP